MPRPHHAIGSDIGMMAYGTELGYLFKFHTHLYTTLYNLIFKLIIMSRIIVSHIFT